MTRQIRSLENAATAAPPEQETAAAVAESEMAVVLATLICALICVAGLFAVVRCAWIRQIGGGSAAAAAPPPPNKGLKKKALKSLPRFRFHSDSYSQTTDCAICLADFADGEEIRVLPFCGHAFHVACIDRWLTSRSSCPSCRQILAAAATCHLCGGIPWVAVVAAAATEAQPQARVDHRSHVIIPAFLA